MISRRNIRIKAMQAIYSRESAQNAALQQGEEMVHSKKDILKQYTFLLKMFETTVEYFTIFWVHFFHYLYDHSKRYAKDIHETAYDKFYQSSFFQTYRKSAIYRSAYKNSFSHIDIVWVEKLYHPLAMSVIDMAYYKNYMYSDESSPSEVETLSYLWRRRMADSKQWKEYISEYLPYADCDDEMIVAILNDLMKDESKDCPVYVSKEKRKFGEELLTTLCREIGVIDALLEKQLQHWDKKRLARIDRIILQLGITELLFFTDIPSTVIINEYVDVAKMYSDFPSGAFVNGILDAVGKREVVSSLRAVL